MNKIQEYWNILGNINDWIKYSDTKATILLTLYGIIITIIYSNATESLNGINNSNWTLFFSVLSIIFSALSIVFAFLCINPKLKNSNPNSIIYFGHIQEKFKNADEYYTKSSEILSNETKHQKELSEQIHSTSVIAWKKFKNISWSIRFFAGSLICMIITILTYLK
jgi:hypothetical protein